MNVVFVPRAWDEFNWWHQNSHTSETKVLELIEACRRNPFLGLGKPEKLKYIPGFWSRRIDQAHRLVYSVNGKDKTQQITIASCRGHY